MPIEPAESTATSPDTSATGALAVRRARARMTLAERHLTELSRDAVSSPSALVRALAVAELDGATRALADAAARLADALGGCLLYTSPSPRDRTRSRMPSSA